MRRYTFLHIFQLKEILCLVCIWLMQLSDDPVLRLQCTNYLCTVSVGFCYQNTQHPKFPGHQRQILKHWSTLLLIKSLLRNSRDWSNFFLLIGGLLTWPTVFVIGSILSLVLAEVPRPLERNIPTKSPHMWNILYKLEES